MGDVKVRHCRRGSIHEPHTYSKPDTGAEFACPGVPHDHDTFCCAEHQHHVTPHQGCILR